jgi:tetratricopeptide (TPR) repeat protein
VLNSTQALADDPARALATASGILDAALATGERAGRLLTAAAYVHAAQGRWREASRLVREAGDVVPISGVPLHARLPLEDMNVFAPRTAAEAPLLQLIAAARAASERADESLIDSLKQIGDQPADKMLALKQGLRGLAAARRGDTTGALSRLHEALTFMNVEGGLLNGIWTRFVLEAGRIELATGDYALASQRVVAAHGMAASGGISPSTTYVADFQELRAKVAEARGDTADAREAWRQVIAIWRNADSELQPRVAAAREALKHLNVGVARVSP